jgi:hypothetical protein
MHVIRNMKQPRAYPGTQAVLRAVRLLKAIGPAQDELSLAMEDPARVARFLAAVGEPTEAPRRLPGRGPPYWKSRVLCQTLAEENDGQARWVQETA